MQITINGKEHDHKGDGTVLSLIQEMGADPARIAVVLNGDVVNRDSYATTNLPPGSDVELLIMAGGG